MRVLAGVATATLVVMAGCSAHAQVTVSARRPPTTTAPSRAPTTVATPPDTLKPESDRWCTTADLNVTAHWQAGAADVGMIVKTRSAELVGTLALTNAGRTPCDLPAAVTVVLFGPGGRLAVPSESRQYASGDYTLVRPLGPGTSAVAPLEWLPSWCGPDPGLSPTLEVSFPPSAAALKTQVRNVLPSAAHVPSCRPQDPASVLAVGVFGQTPATTTAGSGQSLSVQPSAGLRNGEIVHVTGTGYKPDEQLVVTECASDGAQTTAADCNLPGTKDVQSDGSGDVSVDFPVIVGLFGAVNVICGRPTACLVAVTQPSYNPTDAATSPIGFSP